MWPAAAADERQNGSESGVRQFLARHGKARRQEIHLRESDHHRSPLPFETLPKVWHGAVMEQERDVQPRKRARKRKMAVKRFQEEGASRCRAGKERLRRTERCTGCAGAVPGRVCSGLVPCANSSRPGEPREAASIPSTAPAALLLEFPGCLRQMFVLEVPARWVPRPCGPWKGLSAPAAAGIWLLACT